MERPIGRMGLLLFSIGGMVILRNRMKEYGLIKFVTPEGEVWISDKGNGYD